METDEDPTAALDAMIAELVASSVELAKAARENAEMLAGLVAERRAMTGPDASAPAPAASVSLDPALAELVASHARDAGVTAEEYLHEAVLAYIALQRDRDLHARVRDAVRTARGTRAETLAVRAQTGQAAARAAAVQSRADAVTERSRRRHDGSRAVDGADGADGAEVSGWADAVYGTEATGAADAVDGADGGRPGA